MRKWYSRTKEFSSQYATSLFTHRTIFILFYVPTLFRVFLSFFFFANNWENEFKRNERSSAEGTCFLWRHKLPLYRRKKIYLSHVDRPEGSYLCRSYMFTSRRLSRCSIRDSKQSVAWSGELANTSRSWTGINQDNDTNQVTSDRSGSVSHVVFENLSIPSASKWQLISLQRCTPTNNCHAIVKL